MEAAKLRSIAKKDVALVVTIMTVFGGVLRYGEKRLDSVEAQAKQFTLISAESTNQAVKVERDQRQEDNRLLNGKLDTITRILIQMRNSGE